RLLAWMAPRLGFLFTPAFVFVSSACIVSAALLTAANRAAIASAALGLYTPASLVLAWIVLYTVVFVHELAHGLACKYFGGSVHETGFLIIYLQPAFYC